MTDIAPRVVLLSAPGEARERLQAAVREAGVELVLVEDAAQVEADAVLGLSPHAVVVVVDGGSEPALARLEPVLAESGISVLFEDADLIAAREGWEAARWRRHLSAKLHRHHDVLPPVPGSSSRVGAADAPPSMSEPPEEGAISGTHDGTTGSQFDPVQWEAALEDGTAGLGDAARMHFDAGADEVDPIGAGREVEGSGEGTTTVAATPDDEAKKELFSNLTLVDVDEAPPGPSQEAVSPVAAEAAPEAMRSRGAVLVTGGLGAPDAVRQLLAQLPGGFPRPLLVRMQLQGGRYDRLVAQMGKATRLPVALAVSGETVSLGRVYFVPPGITVAATGEGGLAFADGDEAWPAALDESDSALILLSGSDVEFASTAGRLRAGALCLAQSPDSAYDAAASTHWVESGGEVAEPEALAMRLAQRWPSLDLR